MSRIVNSDAGGRCKLPRCTGSRSRIASLPASWRHRDLHICHVYHWFPVLVYHLDQSEQDIRTQFVCRGGEYVVCTTRSAVFVVLSFNMAGEHTQSGHMIKMTSSSLGTDYLAIMYSVPLGLLMWGYVLDRLFIFAGYLTSKCFHNRMIMFVAGFISVIFGSKYTPTLATAGSLLLISTIFVAWPVLWTGMQKLSKWIRGTVSTGKPIRGRRGRTKRTSPGDRQQTPPTSDDASGRRDDSLHSVSMA